MEDETLQATNKTLHIVAIGASAGGLEALQDFLSHLPELPNTAIIIAQHLSPTHKSLLVELLSKQTQMQVAEAKHDAKLEANTVYITPPDKEITLSENFIKLQKPSSLIGPKPSVDILFQSLATLTQQRIVAIILSGTGSDGAKGLAYLEGDNFLKIVQDPQTAKYDGMPNSAIQAGVIDMVLPPEKMGSEILLFMESKASSVRDKIHSDKEGISLFDKVLRILGTHTGSDFSNYKTATLERRLEKRMQMLHVSDLKDYITILKSQPKEIDELFNMMLIGVTQFFRDKPSFEALKEHLQKVLDKKKNNEPMRIWVPGCSTGEEAYTLAILIDQIMGNSRPDFNLQIFATDIDARAIAHARRGVYTAQSLDGLPQVLIDKYFIRKGNDYELIKIIRGRVLFSKHDLTMNPPFLRVDLITCRNLLIYFNSALQQQVLPIFHYALNNEGVLFLGKSETIGQFADLFGTLDAKHKIYERKRGGNLNAVKFASFRPQLQRPSVAEAKPFKKVELSLRERIKDTLFNTFEHPYVIVNHEYDIQEVFGDVRLFLSLSAGNIQVNLLKMVNQELQIELRSLLAKVFKENEAQKSQIRKFELYGKYYYVRFTAKPLMYKEVGQELYMIIFELLDIEDFVNKSGGEHQNQTTDHRLQELEMELATTKEHLQTYIEEIETSNEELQSLNEEMQSTNEELQSSNEELETTNEELQSTNEEIQIAYAELKSAHEDLAQKDDALSNTEANARALLNNNLQAFVMIDDAYQIIDYNSKAEELFYQLVEKKLLRNKPIIDYLPPSDVERYVLDFKKILQGDTDSLMFELESKTHKGDFIWLLNNLSAVHKDNDFPNRLTLALLDISKQKQAELQLKRAHNRLKNLLNAQTHYVLRTDLEGRHTYWNQVFEKDYCWLYPNGLNHTNSLISVCAHDHEKARIAAMQCIQTPNRAVKVELDKPARNGGIRATLWDFICLTDEYGYPTEMQCTGIEITQLKQLRESERLLNEAQRISKIGNWNFDFKNDTLTWSDGLYEVFDVDKQTFKENHGSFLSLIDEEDRDKVATASKKTQETGEPFHITYEITTPRAEKRIIEEYGYAEKDDQGNIIRLYGTAQNVTERLQTEEKLLNSDRIFEYSSDMLCIAGFDGYFKVLNPAWSKTLGWSIEEILSKPFIEFVHPDDVEKTKNEENLVHHGDGSVSFENRYLCKNGDYRWLSWRSYPFIEEKKKIYAVVRDFTEDKILQQNLLQSEERFRQVAENNQAVIWEFNAEGIFTYVSSKAKEVWGYNPEEIVGKKYFYELAPLELRKELKKEGEEFIHERKPFLKYQNPLITPDGQLKIIETNGSPFFDEEDKLLGYRGSDIDITEKLKADEEIKAKKELLTKLANQVPGVVYQFQWFADGSTCFPYSSKQIEDIYWLKPEEVRESADQVYTRLHPEDLDWIVQAITESAQQLTLFHAEYRVINPYNQEVEWRQSDATPELLPDGSVLWHGIIQDITERKAKEIELRKLTKAIEQSPSTIVITNLQGNIEYVNPSFEKVTGYSRQEALGNNPRILKSGIQGAEFYQNMWHTLVSGDTWRGELCNKKKNGELYWEQASITPIFDDYGRIINYLAVKEDITEKKEIQSEVERFKITAEKAVYGMAMADLEGNFTYCNHFYAHIHGYTPEELMGKSLTLFHSDTQLKEVHMLLEEIKNEGSFKPTVVWHAHKNGNTFPMFMSGVILFDDFGQPYQMAATAIDMTEFYSTQAKLKESENRLSKIIDYSIDIIVLLRDDGKSMLISPSALGITGYTPEELKNLSREQRIHPDDLEMIYQAHQEVLKNPEKPIKTIYRHKHKTNGWVWLESNAQNFINDPSLNSILLIITDITQDKIDQDTIKESQERLKRLSDNVPNGVVYQINSGKNGEIREFTYVSEGVIKMHDITPEAVLKDANLFYSQVLEEDLEKFIEHEKYTLEHMTTLNFEFRIKRPDGSIRWMYATSTPTKQADGNVYWDGIEIDITDRKLTQQKIEESERKYRIVAENTYNWEFWEGAEAKLLYLSPSVEKITGYSVDAFMQNNNLLFQIIHPEDLDNYIAHRNECLCEQKGDTCHFRIKRKDGEMRYIEHVCQPAVDEQGNYMGIRGSNIDITEKFEYISKIKNLLTLEGEQNKRLLNFTHIVSHNLRSHTANMQGVFSLMEIEQPEVLEQSYVSMVRQSADNLNETLQHLNEVLDVTKNLESKFEPTSVQKSIQMAINSVAQLAKDKGVTVIDETRDCVLETIHAIPAYVDSIILNLITNGIKFSAAERDSYVKINCSLYDDLLCIEVSDNGLGIDLARHGDKMFGMYKTFHKHKDSKGLGLFITKNQVEAMHGTITVESEPNVGSTFKVCLHKISITQNQPI